MKNRIISESSIELCPVCGEHYTSICKCPIGERRCKNSHVWFMCPVHKTCERELQPDSEYIEVTVIAKGGKKRILHACDSDCLSDTIYDNMRSNKIVIFRKRLR